MQPIRKRFPATRRDRGSAMIMVIGAMLVLSAIAAPFAISMAFHRKTAALVSQEAQARFAAEAALNETVDFLYLTHPLKDPTPTWDGERELMPDLTTLRASLQTEPIKGMSVDVRVTDEQGKVFVGFVGMHPNLLRNIFGWSPLVSDISSGSGSLELENADFLDPAGGFIQLDNEIIQYKSISGNRLTGLVRGIDSTTAESHDEGATVNHISYQYATMSKTSTRVKDLELDVVHGFDRLSPYLTKYAWSRYPAYDTQPTLPHAPVNANSASRRVLEACFRGLSALVWKDGSTVPAGPPDATVVINLDQARLLADAVVSLRRDNPLRTADDLRVMFNTVTLDPDADIDAYLKTAAIECMREGNGPGTYKLHPDGYYYIQFNATTLFCYRSYDCYTIEATAILNAPSGMQQVAYRVEQLMDITPPGLIPVTLDSQDDFEGGVDSVHHFTRTGPNFIGFEAPDPDTGDVHLAPTTTVLRIAPPPKTSDTTLTPDTVDNAKGMQQYFLNPDQDTDNYEVTIDGLLLNGEELSFDSTPLYSTNAGMDDACIGPGCMGFWIRPDAVDTDFTLVDLEGSEDPDVADSEYQDRLYLRWNASDSQFEIGVGDTSIKDRVAVYVAPFELEEDRWYFVEFFYHSDQIDGMGVIVDGAPVPGHYLERSMLAEPLLPGGLEIILEDASAFSPDGGVAVIDNGLFTEIVQYQSVTDNTLVLDDVMFRDVRRGTTSAGLEHKVGATVTPYGYRAPLSTDTFTLTHADGEEVEFENNLLTNGGILDTPFGKITETTITGVDPVNLSALGVVEPYTETDTGFHLVCYDQDLSGFPAQGWLKVNNEILFYSKIESCTAWDATGNNPIGTAMGFLVERRITCGTVEANIFRHPLAIPAFMSAIKVDTVEEYPDYAFLAFDDEWFGPLQKMAAETDGPIWSIPVSTAGMPFPVMRRALFDTELDTHTLSEKAIQICKYTIGAPEAGDVVTMVRRDNTKELMTVARGHFNSGLAAFTDFTTSDYRATEKGRMLKFPSGELPGHIDGALTYFGTTKTLDEPFLGNIDDITVVAAGSDGDHGRDARNIPIPNSWRFRTAMVLASEILAESETLVLTLHPNLNNYFQEGGGYVLFGEEWIGLTPESADSAAGTWTYTIKERGAFDSEMRDHAVGTLAWSWSLVASSTLEESIDADSAKINCRYFGAQQLPTYGHVEIEDEVFGYTELATTGTGPLANVVGPMRLTMPIDLEDKPQFRGSFGTPVDVHDDTTVCLFRYTRFQDRLEFKSVPDPSQTMSYEYQCYRKRDARWGQVSWQAKEPDNTRVRILVRTDVHPEWTTPPGTGYGQIVEAGNGTTLSLEANIIEFRILFDYEEGAWEAGSWRQTPKLEQLVIQYKCPNQVLFRQEYRY